MVMAKPLRESDRTGKTCPRCRVGELVTKQGKWGAFIGCTGFPACTYTQKIEAGGKSPEEIEADRILRAHGYRHLVEQPDFINRRR